MKQYHIYILAGAQSASLEVGATTSLVHSIWQQRRQRNAAGGSVLAAARRLVWFETFDSAEAALEKERVLRQWQRNWLVKLVEAENPLWLDLYPGLLSEDAAV